MALFISFVGLQSCFLYSTVGPGYSVSIEVTNSIRPGTENNDFIDIALEKEKFTKDRVTSYEHETYILYTKKINQPELGHPYIQVIFLTHFNERNPAAISNTYRIIIHNDYEGQRLVLKQEIDRVSDILYNKLETRFGIGNVLIKRQRTGPPF
jgi:hypothetical protein